MNISLPDEMKDFIEAEVQENGYSTASEYVRQLVREAQKKRREEKLESLLLEGLESGHASEMKEEDWEEIKKSVRRRHAKRKSA